ncbi:hypothetical protein OAC89_03090 [Deltaproteobacteria bacterium]|nr:hypothetical protein [Deltaproteobacteria bacterium]
MTDRGELRDMGREKQHLYKSEELKKAYCMGLESTVFVLEKPMGLTPAEQRCLINRMKKKIIKDKISAFKVS